MQITPTVYMHQSSLIPRPQHTAAVKLGPPGNEPALMFVEGKSDAPALNLNSTQSLEEIG